MIVFAAHVKRFEEVVDLKNLKNVHPPFPTTQGMKNWNTLKLSVEGYRGVIKSVMQSAILFVLKNNCTISLVV